MKIRMKRTQVGSPDGARSVRYHAGEVHDLTGSERERELASVFVREGWAERVEEERPIPAAPEHRSLGAAPQNKGRRG